MAFNPNASQLSQEQILQQVFNPDDNSLRTDVETAITIDGEVNVDISAAAGDNISIASQDGTKHLVINSDGSINTDITSSALPANAAQENGGHLASIDGKLNSLGQKVMTASVPVVIASDQSTLAISATSLPLPAGASTSANQITGNNSLSSIDAKVPSNLTVTSTRLLVDGSGVTQPVSGSVTVTQSTAANLNATVDGNIASLEADSGNPVKIGSVYNTAMPAVVTGERVDVQSNISGEVAVRSRNNYSNLAGVITKTIKTGRGVLSKVILGTISGAATISIYDNTVASGMLIATISPVANSACATIWFDCEFTTGLTIASSGLSSANITVVYL